MTLVKCEQWIEVRPLITAELEASNFAPVLDVLYNWLSRIVFLLLILVMRMFVIVGWFSFISSFPMNIQGNKWQASFELC